MHYNCHIEQPLIYKSGYCSIVTSSHLSISVNPYTFLNIQNRDNTPVKQSNRLSSDNLKKILHIHEHKHNTLPDHIQYEHKGSGTEKSAIDQIRDLICCVYYC